MKKPLILLAFANDQAASLRLSEEERSAREALAAAHDSQQVEFLSLGHTSLDDIYRNFNRFHNRIALFHYGGHSDSGFLQLEGTHARAANLATLMGMQQNLQLVFLNGCSNYEQVEVLFSKGVKAVIATTAAVEDEKALQLSRQFYQSLANGKTIEEAFETAASYVGHEHPGTDIRLRKLGARAETATAFPWGLYVQDDRVLGWAMPAPPEPGEEEDFQRPLSLNNPVVNQALVGEALKGVAAYQPAIQPMLDMAAANPALFNTLQNTLLDLLPSSLSIQVRDLFTPEGKSEGRLRLREINEAYLTLARILCAISLSNLWDEAIDPKSGEARKDFRIRPEYHRDLREFLSMDAAQARRFDYIWLVASVIHILSDNGRQPFITELGELYQDFLSAGDFYDSYRFLEQDVRQRLLAGRIAYQELEELCEKAEYHLGVLLRHAAFLGAYQVVTIKMISVSMHRRSRHARFVHSKAILQGRDYVTIDDAPVIREDYTCNNSVLVTKDITDPEGKVLVLSPFMIDENAFKLNLGRDEQLPKIHFYHCRLPDGGYYYEHAERLGEGFEARLDYDRRKYKELEVLAEQFDLFIKDLGLKDEAP